MNVEYILPVTHHLLIFDKNDFEANDLLIRLIRLTNSATKLKFKWQRIYFVTLIIILLVLVVDSNLMLSQ